MSASAAEKNWTVIILFEQLLFCLNNYFFIWTIIFNEQLFNLLVNYYLILFEQIFVINIYLILGEQIVFNDQLIILNLASWWVPTWLE